MTGTAPEGVAVLVLMAAAGIALVRAWPGPSGAHRGPRRTPSLPAVLDEEQLIALLPPWPEPPVYGAAVVQGWRYCPTCKREEPSVLQVDGWRCGHCFTTTGVGR